MRIYGRIFSLNPDGTKQKTQPPGFPYWVVVQTDAAGFNDWVFITNLCQVLLLNLNESPFYANWGIPAEQAVISQVQPDYYVAQTQQFFSQYFASLIIAKQPAAANPTYNIAITTHQGVQASVTVQVPQ